MMPKKRKLTETLANGYSSESTQRELSNEYQHDRVKMIFIIFWFFVHWTKVALALEGLRNFLVTIEPHQIVLMIIAILK